MKAECSKVVDKEKNSVNDEVLTYSQMVMNVAKTKMELRKLKFPKSRLKLKRSGKGQRVQIDLNFHVKNQEKNRLELKK